MVLEHDVVNVLIVAGIVLENAVVNVLKNVVIAGVIVLEML